MAFDSSTDFARLGPLGEEADIVDPLLSSLSRFSKKEIDAIAIDRAHEIPKGIIEGLAELGVFGLSIPEEYDGAGLSLLGVCAGVAELARYDRSVATTVGLHLGLGTRGMIAFGEDALKKQYLPDLASGNKIAAFATTEAGAGSDLAAIKTTAVQKGDQLLVNGSKVYVTNGRMADVITITASTPGLGGARRGHSLMVLEPNDRGVTIGEEEDKLGLRGSSTASVFIDDAEIPMGRIIGTAGKGMAHLAHVLSWGRTAMAAGCVGAAAAGMQRTLEQVTTRVQFGKPIGAFEVVRGQIADMAALCFAMGASVRHTCLAENDRELLIARSTATKVLCSEGAWAINDEMIQLHGGSGFIEETGLPLILRDARVTRIFEGANDVLRCHMGTMEAAVPPARQDLGRVEGDSELGPAADAMYERISSVRDALRKEHGIRLMRKQRQLHRLGRLSILQSAVDAAVLRARADNTPLAKQLASHWIAMARARMEKAILEPAPLEPIDAITSALYEEVAP